MEQDLKRLVTDEESAYAAAALPLLELWFDDCVDVGAGMAAMCIQATVAS